MLRVNEINSEYSFSAIYKILNLINNKCYIGQSQNLYKRFLDYKKGRFSPHLKKSVEKYGIDNFRVEVIEQNILFENLNEKEQFWIDYYESFKEEKGYNICKIAGTTRGLKKSEKEKEEMSKRAKNRIGDKNPFYNKKHTEETKRKIGLKNSDKKLSEEHINKFCKKGAESCKKKVIQLTLDDNYIKTWDSIIEASISLHIPAPSISKVVHNKRKSTGGFKWELTS